MILYHGITISISEKIDEGQITPGYVYLPINPALWLYYGSKHSVNKKNPSI